MGDYTVEELYEQAKRILRFVALDTGLAEEGDQAFLLVCRCGATFPKDSEVGMIAQHFELSHGWTEESGEELQLELVWIGEGSPPEPET